MMRIGKYVKQITVLSELACPDSFRIARISYTRLKSRRQHDLLFDTERIWTLYLTVLIMKSTLLCKRGQNYNSIVWRLRSVYCSIASAPGHNVSVSLVTKKLLLISCCCQLVSSHVTWRNAKQKRSLCWTRFSLWNAHRWHG